MIGLLLLFISLNLYFTQKFYFSLLLFFLFLTNGYQVIPIKWLVAGLPIDKGTDLAIIYILVIFINKLRFLKSIVKSFSIVKYLIYFIYFTIADLFYSIIILNYSLVNVIQVFRQYLIFLVFVPFVFVPLSDLKKVFNSIAFITLLQCLLFLIQIVTQSPLLNAIDGTDKIVTTLEGSFTRFYNSPAFLIPISFYFILVYKQKNLVYHFFTVCILVLTIIGPLHRAGIMAFIVSLAFYLIFKKGNTIYIFVFLILVFGASLIDVVNNRMTTAFLDLSYSFRSSLSLESINQNDNTFLFRIGHFLERFDYLTKFQNGWLFGIGLISDNSIQAQKLPFTNGLVSEFTGQVVQIDSGDLIYSQLVLTTGIIGTILYLFIFGKFSIYFYKNLQHSEYSIIGLLTILYAFFTSMAGTEMLSYTFRVYVILISIVVFKQSHLNNKLLV
jgi:hypothetical protein